MTSRDAGAFTPFSARQDGADHAPADRLPTGAAPSNPFHGAEAPGVVATPARLSAWAAAARAGDRFVYATRCHLPPGAAGAAYMRQLAARGLVHLAQTIVTRDRPGVPGVRSYFAERTSKAWPVAAKAARAVLSPAGEPDLVAEVEQLAVDQLLPVLVARGAVSPAVPDQQGAGRPGRLFGRPRGGGDGGAAVAPPDPRHERAPPDRPVRDDPCQWLAYGGGGVSRRTHADVETATIVAERAGVLSLRRQHELAIDRALEGGRLTGADATAVKQVLRGFADAIAIGLHRDAGDTVAVRDAMRAVVEGRTDG